jgi:hypothetical protein
MNGLFELSDPPQFSVNDITKKVTLTIQDKTKIWITEELSVILGFAGRKLFEGPLSIESSQVCDMNRGFYSIYCYCSLVEPVFVGDVRVPLLRIIPIKGQYGETITQSYNMPQYMPVNTSNFDTLEINLRDDTGRAVPFERGKVVVTLHFRLRRSPYLL